MTSARRGNEIGDTFRQYGEEARDRVHEAGDRVKEYYHEGLDRAKAVEKTLEHYIREKPLQSILIAAGISIVAGLLIGALVRQE